MAVEITKTGKLNVSGDFDSNNKNKIKELNKDSFFSNPEMNFYGRQLVYYLCNSQYHDLSNPEPVDLNKNTLAKVLTRLLVIDRYIKKSLTEYTSQDINRFINDFMVGKVSSMGNKAISPSNVSQYIREFKRFWRVFREYQLKNNKNFDYVSFEWGLKLRAPKHIKKTYEKYPFLTISQITDLFHELAKKEYEVRALLSVNLMGRKCEVSSLRRMDIDIRSDGGVFVQLPQVKKHSSIKVPVELYSFVKKKLLKYLHDHDFKDEDIIFPSKDSAFSKNLREVSEKTINARINPKTLRKLGVCVAEQLKVSRSDVERIGGWVANSPVLEHYFNRSGVEVKVTAEKQIERELYQDVYSEMDTLKNQNTALKKQIEDLKNQQDIFMKSLKIIKKYNETKRRRDAV